MKTRLWTYGYSSFVFACEDFENGQWLDTVVYLNGNEICVIAGCEIDNFIDAYKSLIDKYKV